ncbi:MAG: UDP-3-O-(3-hydroxymyristoyl)glucosamine N-acyltransferase [Bacteroidetes bacterium]|nr:UDP-3-O-(3-hydroxymyristoyl)glucosamine N-acyltransferase [Bacteroidota bacterium]MCW5896547.1 UDP-3-O-(3-hydroxymyristoyl)glucosamine N-acyltransferase [Bacteroidota bacterium]
MKLRDIAVMVNAEIDGNDDIDIRRVAKIEEAGEGDITFLANPKYQKFVETTKASAVIVAHDLQAGAGTKPALVRVKDPYVSFLKVLQHFRPPHDVLPPGIHPAAVIANSATLGADVRIGAHVVLGERVHVGDGVILSHNVVIGDDARIGDNTILYPNVTVYYGCVIGARVIIHSGTTIGSDGFGFAPKPDGTYEKIPQRGIVVIEDDVEIGANCAVDRATLGETRIKSGVKLDNLIQVAHNVVIGENTVSAAQAGISGSTKVGKNCMLGGQVGLTGHLTIADGTKIGAQSGVHRSVEKPNTTIFGYPAYPQREAFRIQGAATQLPDLIVTVRELQKRVAHLEEIIKQLQQES